MKIGIIGLGLIGGSIFKGLRLNDKYEVIGISSSVNEYGVSKDYNNLKDCSLVFVCTPMSVTLEILDKLESILPADTVVTDVCSIKGFVSKKKYKYNFIPSHPMAGTEHSGWNHSLAELFHGAKWILTPPEGSVIKGQDILEEVITDLGAKIIITTPEEHDKAAALISHAPMLIAQAMCNSIKNNKLARTMAASGFRDTTRLALTNTQMAEDMINLNLGNIKDALNQYTKSADSLLNSGYGDKIKTIKEFRKKLYE